jgi:DNA-binding LacI/PurR family transcriptional regulator
LIAPNVSNPYFAEFLRAFQHAADLHGYFVIFVDVNEDEDIEAEAIRRLRMQTDGIALCAPRSTTDALTHLIDPSTTVIFNREIEGAHCITLDSSAALQQVIDDLASAGHSSFIYVPDASHAVGDQVRRRVCLELAEARSMTMIVDGTQANDQDRATHAVSLAISSRTNAILAHSDIVGMWILHECHIRGIDVPGSMSVVGHDNIELVAATSPPMSTIDAKIAEIASRMARTLISSLESSDRSVPKTLEVVEAAYVGRSSIGPPAAVTANH